MKLFALIPLLWFAGDSNITQANTPDLICLSKRLLRTEVQGNFIIERWSCDVFGIRLSEGKP